MEQEKEFKAGDEVTVDRYNAKGEEVKTKIERINPGFTGQDWWYVVLINGVEIQVRGGSIVESKYYDPVPDDQRHPPA
jgi:hypothetical protein